MFRKVPATASAAPSRPATSVLCPGLPRMHYYRQVLPAGQTLNQYAAARHTTGGYICAVTDASTAISQDNLIAFNTYWFNTAGSQVNPGMVFYTSNP